MILIFKNQFNKWEIQKIKLILKKLKLKSKFLMIKINKINYLNNLVLENLILLEMIYLFKIKLKNKIINKNKKELINNTNK